MSPRMFPMATITPIDFSSCSSPWSMVYLSALLGELWPSFTNTAQRSSISDSSWSCHHLTPVTGETVLSHDISCVHSAAADCHLRVLSIGLFRNFSKSLQYRQKYEANTHEYTSSSSVPVFYGVYKMMLLFLSHILPHNTSQLNISPARLI